MNGSRTVSLIAIAISVASIATSIILLTQSQNSLSQMRELSSSQAIAIEQLKNQMNDQSVQLKNQITNQSVQFQALNKQQNDLIASQSKSISSLKSQLDNATAQISNEISTLNKTNGQLRANLSTLQDITPKTALYISGNSETIGFDEITSFDNYQAFNCALIGCSVAESFRPLEDIKVERVAVPFINGTGTVTMGIRPTVDTDAIATTATAKLNGTGWVDLSLKDPIVLSKGTMYFLRWDTIVDINTRFPFKFNNPYPYGDAWADSNGAWNLQTTQQSEPDMLFRIMGTKP